MIKTKLLLVEDDEDDFIITRDLLRDLGEESYSLDWVHDVESARAELSANRHDVCLMDYSLGPEDGVSLLREASQLGFRGPIIMLTGQDDERLDADALSAGAVDYLVKSQLNASRLARAIRYAVARKEMEAERVERLRAESENRSKSEFLAHLSHELRTPLTAILGYTDLMLSQAADPVNQDSLQVIKRNGHHLLSLLNDVLDLSKIEAGKLEIEYLPLDLHAFLADIFQLMAVKAKDKFLELNVNALRDIPTQISMDSTRLRQILLNLLGNAIKFTQKGSVSLSIDVKEDGEQHLLLFHIEDTGRGISDSDLQRIFKPFSQAAHSGFDTEKGTGLGLAISLQLASRLGGTIEVSSHLGAGSRFTLSLPLQQDDWKECKPLDLTQPSQHRSLEISASINGRILVADDVPEILNLVGHIIQQAGGKVTYACDGREALAQSVAARDAGVPFDLLILDMQMPGLSGLEVTQKLRQMAFSQPIIALTATAMKGQKDDNLRAGFTDHLTKPIDQQQLLTCIRDNLAKLRSASQPCAPCSKDQTSDPRILLVEDDRDARQSTAQLLRMLGCGVEEAETAASAVDKFTPGCTRVVLLDINLPDDSGYHLAQRLREKFGAGFKIIALTGEEIPSQVLHESDLDDCYLKPVDMQRLKAVVETAASDV